MVLIVPSKELERKMFPSISIVEVSIEKQIAGAGNTAICSCKKSHYRL